MTQSVWDKFRLQAPCWFYIWLFSFFFFFFPHGAGFSFPLRLSLYIPYCRSSVNVCFGAQQWSILFHWQFEGWKIFPQELCNLLRVPPRVWQTPSCLRLLIQQPIFVCSPSPHTPSHMYYSCPPSSHAAQKVKRWRLKGRGQWAEHRLAVWLSRLVPLSSDICGGVRVEPAIKILLSWPTSMAQWGENKQARWW